MSLAKATINYSLYLSLSILFLLCLTSFSVSYKPVTHTVEISQMKFKPAALDVKKGDKVVFINKDIVSHDVTETSGKSWKSPTLAPGKSWSLVVTQNQTYFCSIHPVMKGSITVKQ
jgi:plastocyanin